MKLNIMGLLIESLRLNGCGIYHSNGWGQELMTHQELILVHCAKAQAML